MASMPELSAIPIVYDAVPVGLLTRSRVMELCASVPNMQSLLSQPVARIMDKAPEQAEVTAPAAFIAKKITDTNNGETLAGIIATEDGRYVVLDMRSARP